MIKYIFGVCDRGESDPCFRRVKLGFMKQICIFGFLKVNSIVSKGFHIFIFLFFFVVPKDT
jgi:hypothetical protein